MITECFWTLRRWLLFFNFTPNSYVRYEAGFVGHNLIFCLTLSTSGANIQACKFPLIAQVPECLSA